MRSGRGFCLKELSFGRNWWSFEFELVDVAPKELAAMLEC